ncbi:MAG: hypothetical protein QM788_13460 [Roseateles sp.]|uniref:hypothetical protein n=1 Tax=Roseateles sp. TaxID=1971397 RepID=UPI0039ECB4A3
MTSPRLHGPLARALAPLARQALPLLLRARRRLTRDAYARLLHGYRLDFLQARRAWPAGIAWRLLDVRQMTPQARAYRLQAPPGLRHRPGDVLLLQWHNGDADVQALLARTGWPADAPVRLPGGGSAFLPAPPVQGRLADVLREHLDFRGAAPPPASQMPQAWLAALPRPQPRSYSISGLAATPQGEVVEIIVSDVAGGTGRCSGHLARLRPGIDAVRGWPLAFPLHLAAGGSAPLLVVATGIAAAGPLHELGRAPPRPLWLVVGLRELAAGQPFVQRLLDFAAAHPACRLDLALSRADAGPPPAALPPNVFLHARARVQQVLAAEQARWTAHADAQGHAVLIGHARMGADVQAWLAQWLVASGRAADAAAAQQRLRRMERSLTLQYSLSGD